MCLPKTSCSISYNHTVRTPVGWWKIITCVKEGGRYLPTISCIRHYPPAHLKYTVIDIVNILYSYENKQLLKIKGKYYTILNVLFYLHFHWVQKSQSGSGRVLSGCRYLPTMLSGVVHDQWSYGWNLGNKLL